MQGFTEIAEREVSSSVSKITAPALYLRHLFSKVDLNWQWHTVCPAWVSHSQAYYALMQSVLPSQFLSLLELKPAHARTAVHKPPQLLIVTGREFHSPFIPTQPYEAVQVDDTCNEHQSIDRHLYLSAHPISKSALRKG